MTKGDNFSSFNILLLMINFMFHFPIYNCHILLNSTIMCVCFG